MRYFIIITIFILLTGCSAKPEVVEIPVYFPPKPVEIKPLEKLPLAELSEDSTMQELLTACFQSAHDQHDYISHLWTAGNFVIKK